MEKWEDLSKEKWEETSLLYGLEEEDKEKLVSKLNKTCHFIADREDCPTFFEHTAVPLIRRIYNELGDNFFVSEVLEEYSEKQWEIRYRQIDKNYGLSVPPPSSLYAESKIMDEFKKYFLSLDSRKEK